MILTIFFVLLALSILILVHEFGHFWVAKKNGIWVEEFGLGLPPRLWGRRRGETLYSINLLPIGGFEKLHGEVTGDEASVPKRAFINKSKKVRFAVTSAGIIMNLIFAILAFATYYSFAGFPRVSDTVKVVEVSPGSPAQIAGFLPDDVIKSVNSIQVHSNDDFISLVEENKGQKIKIETQRETITVTPRVEAPEGEGLLGVVITTPVETYFPPLWQRPFLGIYQGFKDALFLGKAILVGLGGFANDVSKGQLPKEVLGPVGILAVMVYFLRVGVLPFINFLGLISVNLAVLNLIPFPPLDGSRLLFIGIEGILGKKILPKFEAAVHTIGMIILILIMLFFTSREIPRLISEGSITGFIESTLPVK